MAKDLTSFKRTPSGENSPVTHLASVSKDDSSHLAVIRLSSSWSDRQFVLTPVKEGFSCAVVSAFTNNYNSNSAPATTFADGNEIQTQLASLWNAKSANSSWLEGHKALCSYFARGYGPWTVFSRKPANPEQFVESGATRIALKFNPRAFPAPKCSSFSAALRVFCPSALYMAYNTAAAKSSRGFSHNDSGVLAFAFSDSLPAPSLVDSSTYSARLVDVANDGLALDATATTSHDYDIWNNATTNSSLPVFKSGTSSTSFFSVDLPITDDALDDLKSRLLHPFWLVVGFKNSNGFASYSNGRYFHMQIGNRAVYYASRIELVFTASSSTFN